MGDKPIILASAPVREAIQLSSNALHAADHLLEATRYINGGNTTVHGIVWEALRAVRAAAQALEGISPESIGDE